MKGFLTIVTVPAAGANTAAPKSYNDQGFLVTPGPQPAPTPKPTQSVVAKESANANVEKNANNGNNTPSPASLSSSSIPPAPTSGAGRVVGFHSSVFVVAALLGVVVFVL